MKIGIDARLLEETGVGRYIRNLIATLAVIDKTNEYVVFLRQKSFLSFTPSNSRWKKVLADVPWHTVKEQLVMPIFFCNEHLDLVHIPYHNPPIFYSGPMVITIHDLTILHFNTGKATMLPYPLYQLKRLGYWLELWIGMRRAKHIIAVSEATKREIIDHFRVPSTKITVIYEGVDKRISNIPASPAGGHSPISNKKRLIKNPYFLYVGNAYPHKNLETLLEAFAITHHTLVLVGNDDYFYRRLKKQGSDRVLFFGSANDTQLVNLYAHAKAFVFPSLMEGFGLPALEALSSGCPIAVSDIPIFHEILGTYATYFDAKDPQSIRDALMHIKKSDVASLQKFLSIYSWERMTQETLDIYERSTRL